MKNKIFLFAILFFYQMTNAQLILSERIKYSEIASPKDKSLFFIDYWATWCGPCIHVASYLTTIQEQFPDELYILSLTQESPSVVRPFLEKHHTKLAVSIDYEGKNFNENNVRALPHGILMDAYGKVIWRGNPANITAGMIRQFLHKTQKTIPIYSFLNYSSYANETPTAIDFSGDYELQETGTPATSRPIVERVENLTLIQGTLQQMVSYLLKVNQSQVIFEKQNSSKTYKLYIKDALNNTREEKQIAKKILKDFGYALEKEKVQGEIIEIEIPTSAAQFWSTDQIDWGEKNAKFLIDENDFSADNITVDDFLYELSELINTPIITKNPLKNHKNLYDWQLHYRFFDLMESNLSDYGFQVRKVTSEYDVYVIKPL